MSMRDDTYHEPKIDVVLGYKVVLKCSVCGKMLFGGELVATEGKRTQKELEDGYDIAIDQAMKSAPRYCPNCGARLIKQREEKA